MVLAFFPLIRADTTFYEGDYFFSEDSSVPTGENGGGGSGGATTISCWKIVDNTCVLEELENSYCPSGYFSTEAICESALEIPEKSFIDKVLDVVKEFFGIETEDEVISTFSIVDSEEAIEDTKEETTEADKTNRNVIAVVVVIIIGYLILNKK